MKHKQLWIASLSLISFLFIGCFVVWKMDRLYGAVLQPVPVGCPVESDVSPKDF